MYIGHVILILIISVGGVSTALGTPHEDTHLLPKQSTVVVQMDVQSLQKSGVYKALFATNPAFQQQLNVARNQFNFDATKDLGVLTIGVDANALAAGQQDDAMVVILNPALPKSATFFEKMSGGQMTTIRHGDSNYQRLGAAGPKATAVARYLGRTVVAKESVIKGILTGQRDVNEKRKIASQGRNKAAQIWIFGTPPTALETMLPLPILQAQIAVSFGTSITLDVFVETQANTAQDFVSEIDRQRQGFQAHPTLKSMGLADILDKVKLNAEGTSIRASLELTLKDIETLMGGLRRIQASPNPATQPGAPAPPVQGPAPPQPGK